MTFRITSLWHVAVYSLALSALTIIGPMLVLGHMLGWLPHPLLFGVKLVTAISLLSIALPLSFLALNSVRVINKTVGALDRMVKFDPLTGLMGRTHFLHLAEQQRKSGGYLALLDADHFKRVNDTFGHEAGDEALKHIAASMMQVVGDAGFVARMGGEEFAIRMPGLTKAQAELLMATLGSKLRNHGFEYGPHVLTPTVSIGLIAVDGSQPLSRLLKGADDCLYKAKARGRDRYFLEEELDLKAQHTA